MVPEKIILISDPRVLKVPIQDNRDPLIDLASFSELKIDQRKSKVSQSFSKIRTSAALKLIEVQNSLSQGLHLLIIEGHRPLSLQKEYSEAYSEELKKKHSDWTSEEIYQEASKYVAPPEIIPPHSTGGAVDLTIIAANGQELAMGTRVNASPEESKNACFTEAKNISKQAQRNRKILVDTMLKNGFINYPTEWWHWSYGDRYWAYCMKEKYALFGSSN